MYGLDEGIYDALVAGGVGALVRGIYCQAVPDEAERGAPASGYPYVLIEEISATDAYTWTQRTLLSVLYQISVVGAGYDLDPLWAILKQVDAALRDVAVTEATLYCRREQVYRPVSYYDQGVMRHQIATQYRIVLGGV